MGRSDSLQFVTPTLEMKEQALDYENEHFKNGEAVLHGSALLDKLEYEEWISLLADNADEQSIRSDWVRASTFFVVRQSDKRIIGMVDIRRHLNDFLASYGGHIGYGVRPSERRKGYASEMLRMALEYAKSIGLNKVMLACYAENIASMKTILKCGGVKEREFVHTDGKVVQVYWIEL